MTIAIIILFALLQESGRFRGWFGWAMLIVIMAIIIIPNVVPSKYFDPAKKSRP